MNNPVAIPVSVSLVISSVDARAIADGKVMKTVDVAAHRDAAANCLNLDGSRFRRTLSSGLQDVFEVAPGVQFGSGSRAGQAVILRGTEDLYANVRIDGVCQGRP